MIQLERDEFGHGRSRWAAYGPAGDLLGYRAERVRAVKLAESARAAVEDVVPPLPFGGARDA